jgi:glycerophosphoryl diester phosphodiesterase
MSGMLLAVRRCLSAPSRRNRYRPPRRQRLSAGTYPAGESDGLRAGADYLEQDLVMTKDDRLVVLHDHYLDRVTDVAQRFPQRARQDGRFYAIDFTLAEIKSLKFTEGFEPKDGKNVQTYPGVSRWANPISAFIPLKRRLSLFRG